MIKYILHRPIAVIIIFLILIIIGVGALFKVPVSLLPNIDVPEAVIKINYPNSSASDIETSVIQIIRENMGSLSNLESINSVAANHQGVIHLRFRYGTRMDLSYIEINEKIDRVLSVLPKDLPRPQVVRVSTSDIPIAYLQIVPNEPQRLLETSNLTKTILKKRIEQLKGVSLVDINGVQSPVIQIDVNQDKLAAVGLEESKLTKIIQESNNEIGSLSVKDGHYRYFVRLANRLESPIQIANIPIRLKNGQLIHIKNIATITEEPDAPEGFHLFMGKEGLVVSIHKQSQARMNDLMLAIQQTVNAFKNDYPGITFTITQDQTYLLNSGIQNLVQDLLYGGILCVCLLFLFLGNFASPILMSISIPVSLLLTFIFFYIFGISFNIISLSGLALGIGMLIDNSIVVIDSITRKRKEGNSLEVSCIVGVEEVSAAVISQVLSTVIIYAPLIYLSGLAGSIIFDQAVALTISLGVSLLVAFVLNPLLYSLFLKTDADKLKTDTKVFIAISNRYHRLFNSIFKKKQLYFGCTLLFMPIGFILLKFVPVTTLPHIEETETLVKIDWNHPVDILENKKRIEQLGHLFNNSILWESNIGINQFILQTTESGFQEADIYVKYASEEEKKQVDNHIANWLSKNYPDAIYKLSSAPNAFTQLFVDESPYFEVRIRPNKETVLGENELDLSQLLKALPLQRWKQGLGFETERSVDIEILSEKVALYGVEKEVVRDRINRVFGNVSISNLKRFGDEKQIKLSNRHDILNQLSQEVTGKNGSRYALRNLVQYSFGLDRKYITADKAGIYHSIYLDDDQSMDVQDIQSQTTKVASDQGISVTYEGRYFANKTLTKELMVVFFISILLLYVLLAVQFEHLTQPLIVMFTIPFGISGAMLTLWVFGGTLNVMAAIGFVVVLGIIVDDPTLKVETINRLRKEHAANKLLTKREALLRSLHEAGEICLKPLLMVSLTTSLALIPILFSGGIGSDLQKPFIYVIVGGLTIGTFLTLWFTPLAYWFITKKKLG